MSDAPLPVERERFAAMLEALEAAYDYGSQERIAAARAACLAAFDALHQERDALHAALLNVATHPLPEPHGEWPDEAKIRHWAMLARGTRSFAQDALAHQEDRDRE